MEKKKRKKWKDLSRKQKIFGVVLLCFIIISLGINDSGNSSTTPSSSNKIIEKCGRFSSQSAVEDRIDELGHNQLSIQLNSSSGCRYQWLVQFVTSYGSSGYCAMTTDGSSGSVEIVDETCN